MTLQVSKKLLVYMTIMITLSPLVFSGLGWWYTSYSIARNNHKLCAILANSDRPVPKGINDPELVQRIQASVKYTHQLRIDYGCIKK